MFWQSFFGLYVRHRGDAYGALPPGRDRGHQRQFEALLYICGAEF